MDGDRRAELSWRGQGRIWATPATAGGGDDMGAQGHSLQSEHMYLTRALSRICTVGSRNACQKLRGKVGRGIHQGSLGRPRICTYALMPEEPDKT